MPCGYKAVRIHDRAGIAFFQDNQGLLDWVNQQSLSRNITCLGDGHDGVWNLIEQIGERGQRREVLDWYHLIENLHKVGGSNRRLRQAEKHLWQGLVNDAIAQFKNLTKKRCDIEGERGRGFPKGIHFAILAISNHLVEMPGPRMGISL